ncbi:MAG: OmpA family protein [Porphyromonadaceae bacterium]|nr:OmpA family protein [Porphyromonadaceae bacterium]
MRRPLFLPLIFLLLILFPLSAAARGGKRRSAPDWRALTRGEQIASFTLTPRSKPLVRPYMQEEADRLTAVFPTEVTTLRDSLVVGVTLPSYRLFAGNDTLPSAEGVRLLQAVAESIPGSNDFRLVVAVHTADVGSVEYTIRLTRQRAETLAQCFQELLGEAAVVVPYGLGATEPIDSNRTYKGRDANRRVELWLVPSPALISRLTKR